MARASAVTLTAAMATTAAMRHKAGHFPSISGLPVHLSSPGRLSHSTSSPFSGQSRQRDSVCLASHGLLNAPGDNNCFLNSAVQIFLAFGSIPEELSTAQRALLPGRRLYFLRNQGNLSISPT